MQANPLKECLAQGTACHVFAVRSIAHAGVVALAQTAGYQGIYVDLQHSPIGLEAAARIFQAGAHAGLAVLARLPVLDEALAARIIDAGAHGVILADVRHAAQAQALVRATLLPPQGERSFGMPVDPRFPRLHGAPLMAAINQATLLIAMVESPQGISEAGQIAATPGIDALMIGCADLSAALGVTGDYAHPRLVAAIEAVAKAARQAGKPFITGGIRQAEDLRRNLARGAARCYFTGSDTGFVLEGARTAIQRALSADAHLATDRHSPETGP